eukprot:1179183-Prorocentrum_minimum.AAC.7
MGFATVAAMPHSVLHKGHLLSSESPKPRRLFPSHLPGTMTGRGTLSGEPCRGSASTKGWTQQRRRRSRRASWQSNSSQTTLSTPSMCRTLAISLYGPPLNKSPRVSPEVVIGARPDGCTDRGCTVSSKENGGCLTAV